MGESRLSRTKGNNRNVRRAGHRVGESTNKLANSVTNTELPDPPEGEKAPSRRTERASLTPKHTRDRSGEPGCPPPKGAQAGCRSKQKFSGVEFPVEYVARVFGMPSPTELNFYFYKGVRAVVVAQRHNF